MLSLPSSLLLGLHAPRALHGRRRLSPPASTTTTAVARARARAAAPLEVFVYGSLLWEDLSGQAGGAFAFAERAACTLPGYRRALCILSVHYRGTADDPGLVLGLEEAPGAACRGALLTVPAEGAAAAEAWLDKRELISDVYVKRRVDATLEACGTPVAGALAYVADTGGPQYAAVEPREAARMVASAEGSRGTSLSYLESTLAALDRQGVEEPELERVLQEALRLVGTG